MVALDSALVAWVLEMVEVDTAALVRLDRRVDPLVLVPDPWGPSCDALLRRHQHRHVVTDLRAYYRG